MTVHSQFEAFNVLKSGSHKILENLTISFCDPTKPVPDQFFLNQVIYISFGLAVRNTGVFIVILSF